MHEGLSNTELLSAWRDGDSRAADVLFQRYLTRLTALVRSRLSRRFSGRVDPEDVVQSAWRSFFLGVRDGHFGANDGGELWPLLVTITLRKLSRQAKAHLATRRDVRRELGLPDVMEAIARDPAPEESLLVSDQVEHLAQSLDPTAAEVLLRSLGGSDTASIAREIGASERTVRRVLQRIRGRLNRNESARATTTPAVQRVHVQPTHALEQLILHELIGQGAFSKVFRATDTVSRETVAVKFLRKSLWADGRATQSVRREYAALQDIRHPGVLHVLGWGESPAGGLFLVSEFLQGRPLTPGWVRDRDELRRTAATLEAVAEALNAAHERGVIHGDLKPANIMRTREGRIVLMDFGMARWFQQVDDQPPRGGTVGFLSPEQISPAFGTLTPATDVYAWGALAYALMAGAPPFGGRDLPDTIARILSSSPPGAPSTRNGCIPREWDDLIVRCLAKAQTDRLPSLMDVLAELRHFAAMGMGAD